MLRLVTLGGLSLTRDDGTAALPQRRRLALLAILAVARSRGVSRDKIQALLWSESTAEHARHALEQLIHLLRRQFGEQVILGPDPLRLNPELIATDVGEVESALAADRNADAVELYRGDFLDGFYLGGAGEFDHWVERERARLSQMYRAALERLALEAGAREDHAAAVGRWRRLVESDPLSATANLGLMRSLVVAGDVSNGLRQARAYASLVQAELGAAPPAAVLEFETEIRSRLTNSDSNSSGGVLETAENAVHTKISESVRSEPRFGRKRIPIAVGAGLGLIALGSIGLSASLSRKADSTHLLDRTRILIAPFEVSASDSSFEYLREGLIDLVASRVSTIDGVSAVDPTRGLHALNVTVKGESAPIAAVTRAARLLGAGRVLQGGLLITSRESVVLTGDLRDVVNDRVVAHAGVSGVLDSIAGLADRLAVTLLALEAEPRTAVSLTNIPPEAVRAYLVGRAAFRRAQYVDADAAFTQALQLDSTFLQAGLGLAFSGYWTGQSRRGAEVAWPQRRQLVPADRAVLEAIAGPRFPALPSERETLEAWERAAESANERAEVWFALGDRYLGWGARLGIPDWQSRARRALTTATELDSTLMGPKESLFRLSLAVGDTATVRAIGRRLLGGPRPPEDVDLLRWEVATALADSAEIAKARAALPGLPSVILFHIAREGQLLLGGIANAEQAAKLFESRSVRSVDRYNALKLLEDQQLNLGRPQAALPWAQSRSQIDATILDSADIAPYPHSTLRGSVLNRLYSDGDQSAASQAASQLAHEIETGRRTRSWFRDLCVLAQWRLASGDIAGARRAAADLRTSAGSDLTDVTRMHNAKCRALLSAALAVQDRKGVQGELGALDSLLRVGALPFIDLDYFPLALSRLYDRMGQPHEALAALELAGPFPGPRYLSSYRLLEARLSAAVGDSNRAIRAYRHYLALRYAPEPELRPAVDSARTELASLAHQ